MTEVVLNLVVLRSAELERSLRFYQALGLQFVKEKHGSGPEHYACQIGETVFEIYPRRKDTDSPAPVRIGFRVSSVAEALASLRKVQADIVTPPIDSPWGRRAVIRDLDGYQIEITEAGR